MLKLPSNYPIPRPLSLIKIGKGEALCGMINVRSIVWMLIRKLQEMLPDI